MTEPTTIPAIWPPDSLLSLNPDESCKAPLVWVGAVDEVVEALAGKTYPQTDMSVDPES